MWETYPLMQKDETLRQAFEDFGQVTSASVVKDKYSGQSRGFGFVEMPVVSQAQTAIKSLITGKT